MSESASEVTRRVQLPRKVSFLLTEHKRYKVLWGGRDAVKSWSVARAALILGIQRPMRVLCAREILKSIEKSIYQTLADMIETLGLNYFYEPKASEIVGRDGTAAQGTIFSFTGLRVNVEELKSYEGYDLAIVEEANNVRRTSWDTLVNTIRKAGSEIWVVFNPELETDETYQRFIVNPPENAIVVHLTFRDNPWPSVDLAPDREKMKRERPDDYECIWEGRPRTTLADAIYAEEMKAAEREGRIRKVPYDASAPVHTFWDLGFGNHTSIWCGQKVSLEWRMLKFIEDSNKFLPYYVAELQKLPYVWGTDFLPHDGKNNQLGAESIERQLQGFKRDVVVLPQDSGDAGINAVRNVFPFVWFDREGCEDGIQCLRHYRWKKNSDGIVVTREPLHDEYSDGASAFKTFGMAKNKAIARAVPRTRVPAKVRAPRASSGTGSWMGS